jgi:ABC-type transport system involved in multi-copper enzyme maturation permease subunit
MTAHGVLLVVEQEFRVRLRTGRWRWLLSAWVVVIGLFTVLLNLALADSQEPHGVPLFGGLMLFVLGLVLVVTPALTAQSVNGDRERGTLAALQVTRLTAAEIAVGKLVAAWGVGVGALALTLPFVAWSMAEGGVGVLRAAVVLLVVILLIGVVCAISEALSALLARSITSALLSYVTVFALTVGTLVAFGLSAALTTDDQGDTHTERIWWMLAPNPFVVLADAAPQLPPVVRPGTDGADYSVPQPTDPLGELGREVRNLRRPPNYSYRGPTDPYQNVPVWPYGLAFDLLVGAGAVWLTVRRLRTPARALPKGVRVA